MPRYQITNDDNTTNVIIADQAFVEAHYPGRWTLAETYEDRLSAARATASLSRREFFLRLDAAGLYDTVMALKDDPGTPRTTRIELETATQFDRMHPSLIEMAHGLGQTDEQIDALFGINA